MKEDKEIFKLPETTEKIYPLFRILVRGIKCDNPECGWRDDNVKQEDYLKWIDRPCPSCGENLMTKECYETLQQQISSAESLNNFLNSLLSEDIKKKAVETNYAYALGEVDANGHITSMGDIINTTLEKYEEEFEK